MQDLKQSELGLQINKIQDLALHLLEMAARRLVPNIQVIHKISIRPGS